MKKFEIKIFYFLVLAFTFVINSCTKLPSDFDANSSADDIIKTAQEAIAKLMSDKDPKMSRIKKLAGIQ